MEELIKRLERVIQTDVPDKDGMHPISAETVLEVVKGLSEHGTNLAEVGTDLISRAAAQTELQLSARRYTVAHEAHGEGRVVWSEDLISVSDAMDVLRKIPPAQPEIIRCRECKFASGDSRICMKFGHSPIGELDFCAWAERRTDG